LINAQDQGLKEASKWRQFKVVRVFGGYFFNSFSQLPIPSDDGDAADDEMWHNFQCTFDAFYKHQIVVQLTAITILMVLVAHCIQIVEGAGWTLSSTVYFTIVTGPFIES
jgi:hypothetical protein